MRIASARQCLAAECLGTALLLATIVGSGIMAERLSGGNVGVALLANSIATGAMLYVLITSLAPLSGAHFNPAVTVAMWLGGKLDGRQSSGYIFAQVMGGLAGVALAHAMFELPLLQTSATVRSGYGQWIAEGVATFGLVLTILTFMRAAPERVAAGVGLYILAAYWFTASTSFANPAVTVARAMTGTFSGIAPTDVWSFIAAQFAGAIAAYRIAGLLYPEAGDGM